jgi:hypothetical protein
MIGSLPIRVGRELDSFQFSVSDGERWRSAGTWVRFNSEFEF